MFEFLCDQAFIVICSWSAVRYSGWLGGEKVCIIAK